MRWLDKLERHLGFLAVPNLILGVILGQALATVLGIGNPSVPSLLMLDPAAVAAGEWWRLFTWVIVPSLSPLSLIFAIFWFQILFTFGQALEAEWGAFRSTLYLLLGVSLPALGSMLLWHFAGIQLIQTGWYFSLSLQLAFAALMPDFTLMLMFILPVKMKWWAWAVGAFLLFKAVTGGWPGTVEVAMGVGNYLVFFLPAGLQAWRQRQRVHAGQKVFKDAKREAELQPQRACVDCGRGPEADLRLCTCERCGPEGRNYCQVHLTLHLAVPEKIGKTSAPKKKRKS